MDIWGADHAGDLARVNAALLALGDDFDTLDVLLVQFASLCRGGEKVPMSTRSGSFVTLRELRDEVGRDAARFFYVLRKCEQHMDFDLDLAKSQSSDNPVYYIQYAHARICSIFRQLEENEEARYSESALDGSLENEAGAEREAENIAAVEQPPDDYDGDDYQLHRALEILATLSEREQAALQ